MTPEDAKKVGGSDAAALVGLSPWQTPLTVYARIVSGEGQPDSPALRRGRLLEPVVREMYRQDESVELLGPTNLRHPKLEWVRASLDDVGKRRGRGRHAVELKTSEAGKEYEWGPAGSGDVPAYYATQCAWYLGTGLLSGAIDEDVADVSVWFVGLENSPRVYHVTHDAEVYGWLLEAAERFWHNHVVPRRPPPPTNPAREAEAVRRLFKRDTEPLADFATLPHEDKAAVLRYAEARRAANVAEDAFKDAELRLKLALGWRAGVSNIPEDTGLRKLTWTAGEKGKTSWKDVAEALAQETGARRDLVLSLAEQHRGEAVRTLRVTEVKEET